MGRSQADEGGHEVYPAGVGHASSQGRGLLAGGDQPQLVPQPLHGGPGDEDRALERVGDRFTQAPGDCGHQRLGRHASVAYVHEAAGAVGVLGAAGLEAGLAEERRLLVAGHPRHGDSVAQQGRVADDAGGGTYFRQQRGRHAQRVQQLRVPAAVEDVVHQAAGGVGVVRGVDAGQAIYEPRVDGAEHELAALGPLAGARDVIQKPLDLGAGEVGVEQEARALAE